MTGLPSRPPDPVAIGPKRSDGSARLFLLVLLGVMVALVAVIVRPFASALFMGAVLAVVFHPTFIWLARRLRGHRKVAATLITTALVTALVLPVSILGVVAIRESVVALDNVHEILAREGVEGLIRRVPEPIQGRVHEAWLQLPGRERNAQFVFNLERRAAAAIPSVLTAGGQIAAQVTLMVIALFFLLLEGGRVMAWLNLVSPLSEPHVRELFTEFRRVSVSVLIGSVLTAAAQALVALVGYLLAHVPSPYILALATFLLGLVPILGASVVSLAVAVWLYATGHTTAAVFLAIWSVFVVGLVDNVVKPLLIQNGIEMHGAVVFFALIGGFAVFGPVGLVLGPLSVTSLLAILRIYQRDFAPGDAARAESAEGSKAIGR